VWGGYQTKRWRHLRASVLRRDKYRCREAARYGKVAEAATVHHIWPAEEYPEYAWSPWNLISLTAKAHEAMHDRQTGTLTALGESWRRRTIPPTPSAPLGGGSVTGGGTSSDGGETGGGGSGADLGDGYLESRGYDADAIDAGAKPAVFGGKDA
jgi:hypothetical protein